MSGRRAQALGSRRRRRGRSPRLRSSPPSSTKCETSPPSPRRRTPKTKPATNAAMNMLPPRAAAAAAARRAVAAVRRCSQLASIDPRRSASRSAPTPKMPREQPCPDDAVPDFVGHETDGAAVRRAFSLRLREAEGDEEERNAPARVVEAALDVEALADPRGHPHRSPPALSERGIGARDHHRQDQRLQKGDPGEHRGAREGAPTTIVSGRPMPSRRAGMPSSPRRAPSEMRDASENSTSVRVASASNLTAGCRSGRSTMPSHGPRINPAAVKKIAGVSGLCWSALDPAA